MPDLNAEFGILSTKLEHLVHVQEWVRIEEFVHQGYCPLGHSAHDRAWLANAFVAKAVLNLPTTVALMERLLIDRTLRRICGFAFYKPLTSESTLPRAFEEFALGHLSHDSVRLHNSG